MADEITWLGVCTCTLHYPTVLPKLHRFASSNTERPLPLTQIKRWIDEFVRFGLIV